MHPYEMRKLIVVRNHTAFLELKKGSLYSAIDRLLRERLIEKVEASRQGNRPERTIYRVVERGRDEFFAWLRKLIEVPGNESVYFFAGLSHLVHLKPSDVADSLEKRKLSLVPQLAAMREKVEMLLPKIGRVVLVEEEFLVASRHAELQWISTMIDELRNGSFTWDSSKYFANKPSNESKSET